jgi:hypothetical protein
MMNIVEYEINEEFFLSGKEYQNQMQIHKNFTACGKYFD